MTRAFFLAPLIPLAMIYLWTAAHLGWPHALFAIFNPVVWLLALFFGLPVFYLFEILLALPLHRALQRAGRTGWVEYALAGAAVGTVACSVWTEFIRWGPTRIHKDFFYFVPIVIVAGAAGGIAFWRMAVRAIDGAGDETLRWKRWLIIAAPLLVLYLGICALVGSRLVWQEWAVLPLTDPGGFGVLLIAAILLTIALAIDTRKRVR